MAGKSLILSGLAPLIAASALLPSAAFGQSQEAKRIDQIVEQNLAKQGLTPNPPAGDEVFLRRIYLDVLAGSPPNRRPTRFGSEAAGKRGKLIDHLMDSDGYVSHTFNYWADLLRAKSRMDGDSGGAYLGWLKESIAENKPYDQFVRDW